MDDILVIYHFQTLIICPIPPPCESPLWDQFPSFYCWHSANCTAITLAFHNYRHWHLFHGRISSIAWMQRNGRKSSPDRCWQRLQHSNLSTHSATPFCQYILYLITSIFHHTHLTTVAILLLQCSAAGTSAALSTEGQLYLWGRHLGNTESPPSRWSIDLLKLHCTYIIHSTILLTLSNCL